MNYEFVNVKLFEKSRCADYKQLFKKLISIECWNLIFESLNHLKFLIRFFIRHFIKMNTLLCSGETLCLWSVLFNIPLYFTLFFSSFSGNLIIYLLLSRFQRSFTREASFKFLCSNFWRIEINRILIRCSPLFFLIWSRKGI